MSLVQALQEATNPGNNHVSMLNFCYLHPIFIVFRFLLSDPEIRIPAQQALDDAEENGLVTNYKSSSSSL